MPPKKKKDPSNSPQSLEVSKTDQPASKMLGIIIGSGGKKAFYMLLETIKINELPPRLHSRLLSGELPFAIKSSDKERRESGTEGVEIWTGYDGKICSYRVVGAEGNFRILGVVLELYAHCPPVFVFCKSTREHDSQTAVATSIDQTHIEDLTKTLIEFAGGRSHCLTMMQSKTSSASSSSSTNTKERPLTLTAEPFQLKNLYPTYIRQLTEELHAKYQEAQIRDGKGIPEAEEEAMALLKSYEKLSSKTHEKFPELQQAYEQLKGLYAPKSASSASTSLAESSTTLNKDTSRPTSSAAAATTKVKYTRDSTTASEEEIILKETCKVLNVLWREHVKFFLDQLKKTREIWSQIGKQAEEVPLGKEYAHKTKQVLQAKKQFVEAMQKKIKEAEDEARLLKFTSDSSNWAEDFINLEGRLRKHDPLLQLEEMENTAKDGFFKYISDNFNLDLNRLFKENEGHTIDLLKTLKSGFKIFNAPAKPLIPIIPSSIFDALPENERPEMGILSTQTGHSLNPHYDAAVLKYRANVSKNPKHAITPFILAVLDGQSLSKVFKVPLFKDVVELFERVTPEIIACADKKDFYTPALINKLLDPTQLDITWKASDSVKNIVTSQFCWGEIGLILSIDAHFELVDTIYLTLEDTVVVSSILINFERWVPVIFLATNQPNSSILTLHVLINDPVSKDISLMSAHINDLLRGINHKFKADGKPINIQCQFHDLGVQLTHDPLESGPFTVDTLRMMLKILSSYQSVDQPCLHKIKECLNKLRSIDDVHKLIRQYHNDECLCFVSNEPPLLCDTAPLGWKVTKVLPMSCSLKQTTTDIHGKSIDVFEAFEPLSGFKVQFEVVTTSQKSVNLGVHNSEASESGSTSEDSITPEWLAVKLKEMDQQTHASDEFIKDLHPDLAKGQKHFTYETLLEQLIKHFAKKEEEQLAKIQLSHAATDDDSFERLLQALQSSNNYGEWYDHDALTLALSSFTHDGSIGLVTNVMVGDNVRGSALELEGAVFMSNAVLESAGQHHTVIMPINVNFSHWSPVVLVPSGNVLHVLHNDPFGTAINIMLANYLTAYAHSINFDIQIHDFVTPMQTDGQSCGWYTLQTTAAFMSIAPALMQSSMTPEIESSIKCNLAGIAGTAPQAPPQIDDTAATFNFLQFPLQPCESSAAPSPPSSTLGMAAETPVSEHHGAVASSDFMPSIRDQLPPPSIAGQQNIWWHIMH